MRPVLFEIGGISFPAYGTILASLFVVGFVVLWQRTRQFGLSGDNLMDLGGITAGVILLWLALTQVLVSMGLMVAVQFSSLPILAIGAFAYLAYFRRKGLSAERIFDRVAPIVALGLAIQYGIGTLLAGTVYGRPTSLPWGLTFPPGSPAHKAFGDASLHPVQIYLGAVFAIAAAIGWTQSSPKPPGHRALVTFIAVGVGYLALSPVRANTRTIFAGEWPRISEGVAFFLVLYCSIMLWRLHRPSATVS